MDPAALRAQCRQGAFQGHTSSQCPGYLQANVAIVPAEYAHDFEEFCTVNCRPCPILYKSEPGQLNAGLLCTTSDIRTDLPKYCIIENGAVKQEVSSISAVWQSDFVTFYLGCSFTFEEAVLEAGAPVRNVEQKCNVPMYVTDRPCIPVGPFKGNMVVSMRPLPPNTLKASIYCCMPVI